MKKYLPFAWACLLGALVISCNRKPETEAPAVPEAKATHGRYSLEWISKDIPATMSAGKAALVRVSVKNTGDWPWLNAAAANPSKPDGSYAVRLSYRWASTDGKLLPQGSDRGELTATIPPGDTANFTMEVVPPNESGDYRLEVDLVEELVTFFSAKGTQKLTAPVTVQ